ncbi:hypothetical protein MKOR_19160 [Mycolicibacillus koreensis]|nr:hypothetical protein MKOR_19160 [Mycolicibacillus koreensis]
MADGALMQQPRHRQLRERSVGQQRSDVDGVVAGIDPGVGIGVGWPPWAKRRIDSSRWVGRAVSRSRWASTIAASTAVTNSAPVNSNAHR